MATAAVVVERTFAWQGQVPAAQQGLCVSDRHTESVIYLTMTRLLVFARP
jgi:hypothetical protein